MDREDLIRLIANRDGISMDEARLMVDECAQEISTLLDDDPFTDPDELYYQVTETLADYLGLEPDYLDLVLEV